MDRKTYYAVLGLFMVAAAYLLFFRKTDEDRIEGQLRALAVAVHKEPGENEMRRAMRVEKAFSRLLTKEVELSVPEAPTGRRSRHELVTLTVGAGQEATTIGLAYERVHIEIERPLSRAWVTCTAVITAGPSEGGGSREAREVVLGFVEEDGEWRITRVATPGGER